jgi:heat-inducible transcriptional repressor
MARARESRWRRLEIVPVQELTALLVLILQEAQVRQHILLLGGSATEEDLNALATRLNSLYGGLSRREILDREATLEPWEGQVLEEALAMMAAADEATLEPPYVVGLSLMLNQPEFASSRQVRGIVAALEEGRFLKPLLQEVVPQDGVRVLIGQENTEDAMRECSLVLSVYGAARATRGALGILGPRRMDYNRAIPTVRFLAALLTELSTDLWSKG